VTTTATKLAVRLDESTAAFVALIESIEPAYWNRLPEPGVWSVGKETEHVAEAMAYHQWIVRLTLGEKVATRRPAIERAEMTTTLSRRQAIDLIRTRSAEGVALIAGLGDGQLALPTRPPRAKEPPLAWTIERILIDHLDAHRTEIAEKLRLVTAR
jgi:hypothetical protein